MAEALLDLAQTLIYSKNAKITKQEAEVLLACRSIAVRDATLSGGIAGGLVWMATGKLSSFFRSSLAGGVGLVTGMWSLNKSIETCVDHILAMDGTRMKNELAKIMVRRYANDPTKMHLISKYFFSEEVFDDSTPDQPKRRFRQRNNYIDNAAQIQRSPDTYGHEDSEDNREVNNSTKKEGSDIGRLRKTTVEFKPGFAMFDGAEQDDPLDYLLGYSAVNEDVVNPSNSSDVPTRQQSRRQRRLHRRHRLYRHREHLSTMENAQ